MTRVLFGVSCVLVLAACSGAPASDAPILLYDGDGASDGDVRAIEALLDREHLRYDTVGSAALDAMPEPRLRARRLLIVGGGDFTAMGRSLSDDGAARIRGAVEAGLGYLGICAGAFLAGHFPSPYRGLDLASGAQFHFFAAESRGVRRDAVPISRPGAPPLDQYWEDGPELSAWGAPIGRYPDGTAAIVQGASGRGWVVLSGVHPEAPASWRHDLAFATPTADDEAYAITLIHAALDHRELPAFRADH